MKKCIHCHAPKPEADFYLRRNRYRSRICKVCELRAGIAYIKRRAVA